jgi:hypothetical protein
VEVAGRGAAERGVARVEAMVVVTEVSKVGSMAVAVREEAAREEAMAARVVEGLAGLTGALPVAACLVEDLACGHTRARLRNAVSIGREFRRKHARVASGE